MTNQLELDFKLDYLTELLTDLRRMAQVGSCLSHSAKLHNQQAFLVLQRQVNDLALYAIVSNIIDLDYYSSISESLRGSIDLYWGV